MILKQHIHIALLIILSSITIKGWGQRYFVSNQYAYDLFLVNPAAAALNPDCYAVNAFYQQKWIGTDLAPTTEILTFHKAFRNRLGIGNYGFNDRNGNHREIALQQTLAYGITLLKTKRRITDLLFGFSLMGSQRSINMSNPLPSGAIDPVLTGGNENGYGVNANAGALLTVNNWQAGFAATNIFPFTNTLYTKENEPDIRMDLNLHIGTSFKIPDRNLFFEPIFYYRWNAYMDSRTEMNLKYYVPTIDPAFAWWGMIAYRRTMDKDWGNNLGTAATFGIIKNGFTIGLEYEFGLTLSQKEYGSSFQLIAGYRFCRDRKYDAIPCAKGLGDEDVWKAGKAKKRRR